MSAPVSDTCSQLQILLADPSCYEWKPEFISHYGRVSPYVFRTPAPFLVEHLIAIGRLGARKVISEFGRKGRLNLIGVSARGVPVATAIALALDRPSDVTVSTLGKDFAIDFSPESFSTAQNVLVDNALVTGQTLLKAWRALNAVHVDVQGALFIFDREEFGIDGVHGPSAVREATGMSVHALARARDLLDSLPSSQASVLAEYLVEHGTHAARLRALGELDH